MPPLSLLENRNVTYNMMYTSRKKLYYGAAGFLAAILLIAVVSSTPMILQTIFPPVVEAQTGTLIIKVTDAPVPDLQHLNLTINRVEVHDDAGNWTSIDLLSADTYFDLLTLENVTMDLAINDGIFIGNYTKIRLQIVTANATLGDNRTIDLNVPPGHIDLKTNFEIKKDATTSLIVDIMFDKIKIAERGNSGKPANLNPQFKVIVVPPD